MKSDFMVKTAKIIAEIRPRTCIDRLDLRVIEEILQDALKEYSEELHGCYDDGYDDGYAACTSSLEEDGDSYYNEGYSLGHDEGYENGHYEGYGKGHSEGYSEGYNFAKDEVEHERLQH